MADASDASEDEGDWAVSLEDLEEPDRPLLEPGDVSLENAAFVLLGAVVTVGAVALVVL